MGALKDLGISQDAGDCASEAGSGHRSLGGAGRSSSGDGKGSRWKSK